MMKSIFSFLFLLIWILAAGSAETPDEPLLGDVSDGSRAVPVHLIPLLDENGIDIAPDDDPLLPFSSKQTCALKCHAYDQIQTGWHFNMNNPAIAAGRPGHPWIWMDSRTGTQIPLSYRSWPGTYKPEQLELTPWEFVQRFGRHLPGGGVGEWDTKANPDQVMRIFVSGNLEINCLACHDADPAHDQAQYAVQIAKQNFRWAAASTSSFALVTGSAKDMTDTYDYQMPEPPSDPKLIPPAVAYRAGTFDSQQKVFFDIVRKIPPERCYYCHSSYLVGPDRFGKWTQDEDIHLAAGLTCVDCHRNGLDHQITRGYEGESETSPNPLADELTCQGCHLGSEGSLQPREGRKAAPVPQHKGLPPVHFERLTCTVCHSGPWPGDTARRVKTSLAHGLGMLNVDKADGAPPAIFTPVFAKSAQGNIAPHNLIWPAFWGSLKDAAITPLPLRLVQQTLPEIPVNEKTAGGEGNRPVLTEESIKQGLQALAALPDLPGKPVYVCGGRAFQLNGEQNLQSMDHPAARPYLWPVAHDVRPAAQSLGVRGCEDCHAEDSPFFFGTVAVDSPFAAVNSTPYTMIAFEGLDEAYTRAFAFSFRFRPWFKIVTLACAGILILILWIYSARGLVRVMDWLSGKE